MKSQAPCVCECVCVFPSKMLRLMGGLTLSGLLGVDGGVGD